MYIYATASHFPIGSISTAALLERLPRLELINHLRRAIAGLGVDHRFSVLPTVDQIVTGQTDDPSDTCSGIAAAAARCCLERAAVTPQQIDMLISVTNTSDYPMPGNAPLLVTRLGLRNTVSIYGLEGSGCSGFVKGLDLASLYLAQHPDRLVLIVAAEAQSVFIDHLAWLPVDHPLAADIGTRRRLSGIVQTFLFGDGGAALLIGARPRPQAVRYLGAAHLTNVEAGDAELVYFPAGGSAHSRLDPPHRPTLSLSNQLARRCAEYTLRLLPELFNRPDLPAQGVADVSEWLLHSGSVPILTEVMCQIQSLAGHDPKDPATAANLRCASPAFNLCYEVLARYGNLSSASLACILDATLQGGHYRPDSLGVMLGFGSGFSASAALIQFP